MMIFLLGLTNMEALILLFIEIIYMSCKTTCNIQKQVVFSFNHQEIGNE